ncbi:MAG: glycoside hydrolase family 16 protein [Hyphomonas sp.]
MDRKQPDQLPGPILIWTAFAILALSMLFVFINRNRLPTLPIPIPQPSLGDPSFKTNFEDGHDNKAWQIADFYYPSKVHLAAWVAENTDFENGRLSLELNRNRVDYKPYSGAEYQRRGFYHYGRYEVVMQAAAGSGTVSSFFTHTNETFGDPHDEIDIEFLGKDTTRLHINYFTNGEGAGSVYIPLGYDAAEEFHLYAFEWSPEEIKWFVDDQMVFSATDELHKIPSTPSRIIMDLWSGSPDQYQWHGKPSFENGTKAHYLCASFLKTGEKGPQCSNDYKVKNGKRFYKKAPLTP